MSEQDYLSAQYEKQKGEGIVYGGLIIAFGIVLFGVVRAPLISLVAAAFSAGVAVYHWPFVRKNRKALAISPAGITLDRVGLLPWNAIADVTIVERYIRMIRNADLHITLRRPLDAAVENPPNADILRRYMYRCWKAPSSMEVIVKLSTLDKRPEEVEAVARQHLPRDI
jgi:hypothetical protein